MEINNHTDLTEECKKHICECENCGLYPLKHFEKCSHCGSEAFHRYPPKNLTIDNIKPSEDLINKMMLEGKTSTGLPEFLKNKK